MRSRKNLRIKSIQAKIDFHNYSLEHFKNFLQKIFPYIDSSFSIKVKGILKKDSQKNPNKKQSINSLKEDLKIISKFYAETAGTTLEILDILIKDNKYFEHLTDFFGSRKNEEHKKNLETGIDPKLIAEPILYKLEEISIKLINALYLPARITFYELSSEHLKNFLMGIKPYIKDQNDLTRVKKILNEIPKEELNQNQDIKTTAAHLRTISKSYAKAAEITLELLESLLIDDKEYFNQLTNFFSSKTHMEHKKAIETGTDPENFTNVIDNKLQEIHFRIVGTPRSRTKLDALSNEVLLNILKYLDPKSLTNFSITNKNNEVISRDNQLWKNHCDEKKENNQTISTECHTINYFSLYKKEQQLTNLWEKGNSKEDFLKTLNALQYHFNVINNTAHGKVDQNDSQKEMDRLLPIFFEKYKREIKKNKENINAFLKECGFQIKKKIYRGIGSRHYRHTEERKKETQGDFISFLKDEYKKHMGENVKSNISPTKK